MESFSSSWSSPSCDFAISRSLASGAAPRWFLAPSSAERCDPGLVVFDRLLKLGNALLQSQCFPVQIRLGEACLPEGLRERLVNFVIRQALGLAGKFPLLRRLRQDRQGGRCLPGALIDNSVRYVGSRPAPFLGLQKRKIGHHPPSQKCAGEGDRQHNQNDQHNHDADPIHMRTFRLNASLTVSQSSVQLRMTAVVLNERAVRPQVDFISIRSIPTIPTRRIPRVNKIRRLQS